MATSFRAESRTGTPPKRILGFALSVEDFIAITREGFMTLTLDDAGRDLIGLPNVDEIHFVFTSPEAFLETAQRAGSLAPDFILRDDRTPTKES